MTVNFKLKYGILIFFTLLTFAGFAQDGWRMNDNGMKFKFHTVNKEGQVAEVGDLASLHMIITSEDGKVSIKNSYKEKGGKPVLFPVRVSSFPGDIYEAVRMMATGDSASFLLDTDSMYAYVFKKPVPTNLNPDGNLLCTIKMLEIENQKKYLEELQRKDSLRAAAKEEEIKARNKKEQAEIQAYLNKKQYKSAVTETGLHIVKTKMTEGAYPEAHQTALINYTVWLLNGTKVESTEDIGKPFAFNIDENMIIKGWEEGVKNMRVGEKAYLIVPSHLAYRDKSIAGKIPPNSVLVIYVELLSVR